MIEDFFEYITWLTRHIPPPQLCATSWKDWVPISRVIVSDILGDVVEFGSWRGASTAALSGACKIAGKKLFVFDSFQGFPDLEKYALGELGMIEGYAHPDNCYKATLDEAKQTVEKFGCPDVVTWVPGFFNETLQKQSIPIQIAVAFVDVDLPLSQKEAFNWIWPRLVLDGVLFSHEWQVALKYKAYGEQSCNLKEILKDLGYLIKKVKK